MTVQNCTINNLFCKFLLKNANYLYFNLDNINIIYIFVSEKKRK